MSEYVIVSSIFVVVVLLLLIFRRRKTAQQMRQLAEETELQKQQIILEQQRNQQLKQEMTNNIAHELKTPVSSILGYLEILLGDKPVSAEQQRYFLERCNSQALRLSDLIRDVSLINKLEESAELFPRGEVSVSDVVSEVLRDLADRISALQITVADTLPDDMMVCGNRSLLYSIFRNLVENTIAYAGSAVTIGIETYRVDDDCYYIHFYDTGCGVNSTYLPKLFDRFLRIDQGRSRKNGGTGLGLSIVKHAVLFHGGDIYAKNRAEGGLEYFFSLKKS